MKTDEEILYEIYHSYELKTYEKVQSALKNKDFKYLLSDGHPYAKIIRKETALQSTYIDDVINELKELKERMKVNEGFMHVSGNLDENDQPKIYVNYIQFHIQPITFCERCAKSSTSDSMWKLNNQTNGTDAHRIRARIDKYKAENEVN